MVPTTKHTHLECFSCSKARKDRTQGDLQPLVALCPTNPLVMLCRKAGTRGQPSSLRHVERKGRGGANPPRCVVSKGTDEKGPTPSCCVERQGRGGAKPPSLLAVLRRRNLRGRGDPPRCVVSKETDEGPTPSLCCVEKQGRGGGNPPVALCRKESARGPSSLRCVEGTYEEGQNHPRRCVDTSLCPLSLVSVAWRVVVVVVGKNTFLRLKREVEGSCWTKKDKETPPCRVLSLVC